jgi:hypothetical protein
MPRIDLLDQSATRAELDQRSREARLRLERVERVFVVRPMPRQPLLRRVLYRLGWRICASARVARRAVNLPLTGRRSRRGRSVPSEAGGIRGFYAAPPAAWPACRKQTATLPSQSERHRATSGDCLASRGLEPWNHWCRRGDLSSRVLAQKTDSL